MSWPLSQDYNEAIQDPRSNLGDAELKAGEAVTNALGIPMPRSGNFADVYEVRCPSGSRWAVKCFTREVHGLRERYAEISRYLSQVNLPFMVDFKYLEKGIRVRGQWFPVLKMQWVEGFVLNEFVRDNLDKKPILQALGQIWLRMSRRLRKAQLAHCDLQHGNVLFVPGNSANSLAVKLIDYDGMCVPSLAGKNSGEVGHPAYQHPERLRSGAYNQQVDRFSLLSIAAALRCLTVGGRSLWERYDNGDNLLFRQTDLQAPVESPLFRELLAIDDPQAQVLVKELYRACQVPLSAVPLLTDLLPEEKPASKVMTAAARQAAAEQGSDWDFGDDEPNAPVLRKRRTSSGMPLWLWGLLGGTAAFLLSVGVGGGLFLRSTTPKDGTPVARTSPSAKPPNGTEAPPSGIFCLTPAGDKLAISDAGSNTWRLLDPHTNQMLRRFTGHTGPITALAFSADGRRAVTSGEDKMLRLWDVQTGRMIGTGKVFRPPVVSLTLSPDGTKAAYANGGFDVPVWDFEANKGQGTHHGQKVTSVAISPDGRYLVNGYDQSDKPENLVLYLSPMVKGVNSLVLRGRSEGVSCIAVSPDGKYVAAGEGGDPAMVSLWEVATRRLVKQFARTSGPFHQVAFSPDNRFLVAAAVNRYQIWPVEPAPKGGLAAMGGGDSTQDRAAAVFAPDSEKVMFVYRKAGRVARIQTVRLPGVAPAGSQPSAVAGQPVVWDAPVDPDRDCAFQTAGGKLTIRVPGKDHDLGAERGRMNAPRLLCDVEGDFTAQVRVSGDFQPSTDATVQGKVPVVGAGLVLLLDEKTYVRLERFGLYRGAQYEDFCSWELRRDARMTFSRTSPPLVTKEAYLRIERRGDKMLGSISGNGMKWIELPPIDIVLPRKIKLGVDAISTSSRPFAPIFDHFRFKKGQGEMVHVDWP
jgi:regulation of enolase protein 1 (concanavalin A-like superfamily)